MVHTGFPAEIVGAGLVGQAEFRNAGIFKAALLCDALAIFPKVAEGYRETLHLYPKGRFQIRLVIAHLTFDLRIRQISQAGVSQGMAADLMTMVIDQRLVQRQPLYQHTVFMSPYESLTGKLGIEIKRTLQSVAV